VNTGNLATVSEFPSPASTAGGHSVSESPSEPEAFTRLYQSTVAPLRRYLSRLLGNTGEAEEVAHDAYARIYRKHADKPEALLYTTTRDMGVTIEIFDLSRGTTVWSGYVHKRQTTTSSQVNTYSSNSHDRFKEELGQALAKGIVAGVTGVKHDDFPAAVFTEDLLRQLLEAFGKKLP
jgi:hypothetical protein